MSSPADLEMEIPSAQPSPAIPTAMDLGTSLGREDLDLETQVPPTPKSDLDELLQQYKRGERGVDDVEKFIDAKAQANADSGENDKRVPLPGQEDAVAQLQAALDLGDVGPRTCMGQRFTAYLKKDAAAGSKYAAFKGKARAQELKADFRLQWANMEIESKVEVRRTKTETHTTFQGQEGMYKTLDRMIIDEGGLNNPMAVQRSINYAMEATRRGYPYVEWNSWKKATEILVIDKVFKSGNATNFSIISTENIKSEKTAAVTAAADEGETPAKKPRPAAAKQKAIKKDGAEGSSDDKKAKAMVQKKATDLKMKFLAVTAMHTNIQRNVENDSKYEWARNSTQKSRFEAVMTKLNEKIDEHKFNGVWVASDIASAKAEFGEDLSVHFAKFVECKSAVDELEKSHGRFQKMHFASLGF
jgi:hypothetical protein